MQATFRDFLYALRVLRKSPGLSLVMVLSLAIGIGANTTIFSVVDALLLRPLAYPQPERLAILWLRSPGIGIPQDWPSPGQYLDVKTQNHVFEETSLSIGRTQTLTGTTQPERLEVLRTQSSLFHLLGAKPLIGRLLLPDEDLPGKQPVAILSHGAWQRLFGGDRNITGRSMTLDGNPFTIAGVLSPDFQLTDEVMPTVGGLKKIDVFLPLPLGADAVKNRGDENYNILARLRPGVTMEQAQADVAVIASRIREIDKRDRTFTIGVVPLTEQVVGNVRRTVLVLLGSVALVLLIACANVANLLLSRATGRQKEIAIRTALGAGRERLIRQLLTESMLLALLGGAAGLAIAWAGLYVVRTINPGNIPRMSEIGLNGTVLAFTFGISVVTGIVFGLAPALRAGVLDLNSALKAGGRASQGAGGFNPMKHRLRAVLVAGEMALSLMLLIGAGLLVRSFVRLASVPPGFNPDHVISMRVAVTGPKYRQPPPAEPVVQFYREVASRVTHLPGVKSLGMVSTLPLTASIGWGGISIEGYTPPADQPELQVDQRIASTDYFRTMEIPLIRGRFFDDHDIRGGQPAAIVDEKMALRFWPHNDPIGKHIGEPNHWLTIVGVVGTVKQYGLDIDGRMVVYYPHAQARNGGMYVVARTSSDPAGLASAMVREIHAVDSDAPVYEIRTMDDRLHDSLARQRFAMTMLGAFAVFAMILAAVGIYGVMSYFVTQGSHDIGVRLALGAARRDIFSMVLRQAMTLAGVGIAAGLAGALLLTRVMASLLFGISATDTLTFGGVAAFLGTVALVASYIPAHRATRVDPLVALRDE